MIQSGQAIAQKAALKSMTMLMNIEALGIGQLSAWN